MDDENLRENYCENHGEALCVSLSFVSSFLTQSNIFVIDQMVTCFELKVTLIHIKIKNCPNKTYGVYYENKIYLI